MNFKQAWRRLWSRPYFSRREEYITRLRHSAPVVTPEEVAKLERKWKQPIDWAQLGVIE